MKRVLRKRIAALNDCSIKEAKSDGHTDLFQRFFNIPTEVLEGYGAFNVSLINDLPLFIDPILLFDSEDENFKALHEEIIRYVKFLRDVSVDPTIRRRGV